MLQVGTFMGIPLNLHWSWFAFLAFVVLLNGPLSLIFVLLLFMLVILHEYGHCAAAQYLGFNVVNVTIYPIGGVAQIEFGLARPKDEIIIALAGPAVNLVLGLLSLLVASGAYLLQEPYTFLLAVILTYMNLGLLVFNMLPIFPMDGGRVLRGLLTLWIGFESATWWAVRSGQTLCVLGVVLAIFFLGNPLLALIFFIMAAGAQQELMICAQYAILQRIKEKLAAGLGRPELLNASLPEVIEALEDVKDDELRQRFYYDELVPLLKDLEKHG
jgi:Zn-dependent protease